MKSETRRLLFWFFVGFGMAIFRHPVKSAYDRLTATDVTVGSTDTTFFRWVRGIQKKNEQLVFVSTLDGKIARVDWQTESIVFVDLGTTEACAWLLDTTDYIESRAHGLQSAQVVVKSYNRSRRKCRLYAVR